METEGVVNGGWGYGGDLARDDTRFSDGRDVGFEFYGAERVG
jgi:hypothetical protein